MSSSIVEDFTPSRPNPLLVNSSSSPLYLLHFDVNQTICLIDRATGLDTETALEMLFADHAWGTVDNSVSPPQWSLAHPLLSVDNPSPSLYLCYSDYIRDFLVPHLLGRPVKSAEDRKFRKQTAIDYRSSFCHSNHPGHSFQSLLHSIKQQLHIPVDSIQAAGYEPTQDFDLISSDSLHWPNSHFIQPPFYLLLIYLQHFQLSFHLLFRTFGMDLPLIQIEFNRFCIGNHPNYKEIRMDGNGILSNTGKYLIPLVNLIQQELNKRQYNHHTEEELLEFECLQELYNELCLLDLSPCSNLIDRRLYDCHCGLSYRKYEQFILFNGFLPKSNVIIDQLEWNHKKRKQTNQDEENSHTSSPLFPCSIDPDAFFTQFPNALDSHKQGRFHIDSSLESIWERFCSWTKTQWTGGIRDCYWYWEGNKRQAGTGKFLIVDDRKEKQSKDDQLSPIQIFFDDSIPANIVDFRSLTTGRSISSQQAQRSGSCEWFTRTLRLLQEPWYFILAVKVAQKKIQNAHRS
jgi:hypothetical protein